MTRIDFRLPFPRNRLFFAALSLLGMCLSARAGAQEGLSVRVGLDPDFPPYEFKDSRGMPAGFSTELTKAIARELRFQVEFTIAPWSELVERLQGNRLDVLQGIFLSEERARDFDFSNPYDVVAYDAFVFEKARPVTSLASLKDLRIAVKQKKDTGHQFLLQEGLGRELREIQSYEEAFSLLRNGVVDAAFLVRRPALHVLNQRGFSDIVAANLLAIPRRYGYGFRKGDERLTMLFNDGLAVLRQNGTYEELYRKWLALAPPREQTLLERAKGLLVAFGVMVGMAGFIVVWHWRLRVRVREETRELRELNELQERAQKLLIEAKRKAEEANELKSELLGTVSHEIRTPFNGMIGVIELLKVSSLDEHQRRLVGILDQSSFQLMFIVNQILDYSRMERGFLVLEKRETCVEELVRRVVDLYRARAAAKGLTLTVKLEGDVCAPVLIDGPKVEQVLRNLVDNAIKFTEKGHIVVGAKAPAPSVPPLLSLSVEDSGIGIDPEEQSLIFSKFGQIERGTTVRKHGGVGLGLAISRRIAEAMKGSLELKSERGRGARFTFTLPVG